MQLDGRVVYEDAINPISGRKKILAYALRGGKFRDWSPT